MGCTRGPALRGFKEREDEGMDTLRPEKAQEYEKEEGEEGVDGSMIPMIPVYEVEGDKKKSPNRGRGKRGLELF
jgi:hypothetical protein